jgi:hypothetical protein
MNNDIIHADRAETLATDALDLVDCGRGVDTAEVLRNDIVCPNCEDVTVVTPVAAAPPGTTDQEQQQ